MIFDKIIYNELKQYFKIEEVDIHIKKIDALRIYNR